MRIIKKGLFFIISLTVAAFSASSFDYYSDGIYDAFAQMNKDIKSGLSERPMGEYKNKYLVSKNVSRSSSSEIIFYKTVGGKNSLSPQVVRQGKSKRNFLIFGYFDRKANAEGLQKKLRKYGIRTSIIRGGTGYEYTRNPILIKQMVRDLKRSIKRSPARVIRVKKTIPKSQKYKTKKNKTKSKKQKNITKTKKNTQKKKKKPVSIKRRSQESKDYYYLKKNFCYSGYVQKRSLVIDGKNYIVGKSVGNMVVSKIKKAKVGYAAIVLGENGTYYKLVKTRCRGYRVLPAASNKEKKSENLKQKTKSGSKDKAKASTQSTPSSTPSTAKEAKTNNKAATKENRIVINRAVCDFTKLKVVKDSFGKSVRISDTTYAKKSNIAVSVSKLPGDKYKLRGSGAEYIILNKGYFNKACK